MLLREATVEDIEGMHRVRVAVRENALSSPGRITPEDYRQALADGTGWVVETASRIVGFAFAARSGNVWALFVDPDHEGRGYGSALHDIMIEWLRTRATRPLWLTTGTGTRAEVFYGARGWRDCGMANAIERRFEWPDP